MPVTILPLGRDALAWVREGGRPLRISVAQAAMQRWQAWWFEYNRKLQNRTYPTAPFSARDPIFILGLWRTGTTYLHELISACPTSLTPGTWDCMHPSTFLLRRAPEYGPTVARPMDQLSITATSPQEDEFALLALGVPSVYRGFLDPRRLPELTSWLSPDAWTPTSPAGWCETWLQFLGAVAGGRSARMVLKSPNHTFRINALHTTFPEASLVWLVRNPTETILSNRKMWKAMFELYGLWPWEDVVLDDFLAHALRDAADCLTRATAQVSRQHLAVVSFEDFTVRPLPILDAINQRLALGDWKAMRSPLEAMIRRRAEHRADRYADKTLPRALREAAAILDRAQLRAIASHGVEL